MFSKISNTNILTNSSSNNNESNELLNACDTIRSIFPESTLNKKISDIYKEADQYNTEGKKGADNQVSDFELIIWLKNNLKEGILVCDALSEIDVKLPTDFTQLSDQQIIDVCKYLNEDSCIGETLRRDLKPILDGYNNAMQTILKEGVDMQIITAVKIAEALGGKKLDTKS